VGRFDRGGQTPLDTVQARREAEGLRRRLRFAGQGFAQEKSLLGEIERSIEQTRPLLAARARALYKMGDLSYVRLFLSVDRPADMFRGYRFVTALARRDDHRIAAYLEELQQAEASLRQLLDGRVQGEASAATA
jgi:hypothetical protein